MKSGLVKFYEESAHCKWPKALLLQDRVKKMTLEIESALNIGKKGLKVLDIGTGTGELLYSIKKNFPQYAYYGCDIAKNTIKNNVIKKKGINWSAQNFNNKTSYKSNSFNLIISGEVIEHVYDTDNFLYEISRIMKKNGLLIISTPNLASWIDRLFLLFGLQPLATEVSNASRKFGREIFYKLVNFKEESDSAGHLRCFTKDALKSMLKYYGFNVIKDIPCHYHSFFINKLVTKIFPNMSQGTLLVCKKNNNIGS